MEGLVIGGLSVFLSIGVLPLSILYYMHNVKNKRMDTMVKLAELGGSVDPEMMEQLTSSGGTYKTDYKSGLIWLAVGMPLSMGLYLEEGLEAATFGFIPVLIGIAYLISGKLRLRDK